MGHFILEHLSPCDLNDKRHLRQEPVTNHPHTHPPPLRKPANTPQRRASVSVKVVVNLVGKAYALLLEP